MDAGTPAEAMLLDWLNNRPSDEFFEKTLRLIRDILETRRPRYTTLESKAWVITAMWSLVLQVVFWASVKCPPRKEN